MTEQANVYEMINNRKVINRFSGSHKYLSNFYLANVKIAGMTFPSNEHAFQAMKSDKIDVVRKFSDPNMTPGQAKKLGRQIEIRKDWDKIKVGVMYSINLDKFTRHENLKRLLLSTGEAELIEGNTWGDKIWGACKVTTMEYSINDSPLEQVEDVMEGENLLGKILMLVRSELRHLDNVEAERKEVKANQPKEEPEPKLEKAYSAKEFIVPLMEGEASEGN